MSSDPDDRYHGTLTITVLGVSNLHKITNFGIMDPFVTIALNQDKKSTRQIQDGGTECIFNETLYFNIDCQKTDLITIKVKHKTTFSSSTIGVFSLKMMDFVKYQKKKLKFQLVDEVDFQDRGVIELIQEYRGTNAPPMPNNTTVTSPAPPVRSNEVPQSSPSPNPPLHSGVTPAPSAATGHPNPHDSDMNNGHSSSAKSDRRRAREQRKQAKKDRRRKSRSSSRSSDSSSSSSSSSSRSQSRSKSR